MKGSESSLDMKYRCHSHIVVSSFQIGVVILYYDYLSSKSVSVLLLNIHRTELKVKAYCLLSFSSLCCSNKFALS